MIRAARHMWGVAVAAGLATVPIHAAPEVVTERTTVVAITGKAGLLRFAGHEHAVIATKLEGRIAYDPAHPIASSAEFRIPTAALIVDSPDARRAAGLGSGPTESEIPGIQQRMLGPEVLDAANHPYITFRTTSVEAAGPDRLKLRGDFELVGQTRPVEFEVSIRRADPYTIFSGELQIRQRDYGITPVSIAGLVKVADAVRIRFEVALK